MLMLAGMLGLLAVGGAAMAIDFSGESEDEADDALTETEDIATGTAEGEIVPFDQIVAGGAAGEEIIGDIGDDQINGYAGDDVILGADGNDDLHGAAGDDALSGNAGNDTLHGEDGHDDLMGDTGADSLFGHGGDDLLLGGDDDDELQGGDGDDMLQGGAGEDALQGGMGNDRLEGGADEDAMFGGYGDDLLVGGELDEDGAPIDDGARDYLNGGDGDDTLVGGRGDVMTGGDGADRFVLDVPDDQGETAEEDAAPARIVDFDAEEDQLLLLSDLEQNPEPLIEVIADDDIPGLSHIRVNGEDIASVMGGTTLDADDITLIDRADGIPPGWGRG